jgi:hypothetical protein
MNTRKIKHIFFWIIAITITVSSAIYQKKTGPTYPKTVEVNFSGENYKFNLIRSSEIGTPCDINIDLKGNTEITGSVFYKKYKVNEPWTELKLKEKTINKKAFFGKGDEQKVLSETLPSQQEAGKLEYFLELKKNGAIQFVEKENPVVIRFKGAVPTYVLLPHIIFMFLTMLFASITFIYVLAKDKKNTKKYAYFTFFSLIIGGMILGPIVQKYAFSEFWTGIPFGWDLTDNKTLIAFVAWTIAIILNLKKQRPLAYIISTLILYAVFTIPHSAFGSELNYETGKITQGIVIQNFMIF